MNRFYAFNDVLFKGKSIRSIPKVNSILFLMHWSCFRLWNHLSFLPHFLTKNWTNFVGNTLDIWFANEARMGWNNRIARH